MANAILLNVVLDQVILFLGPLPLLHHLPPFFLSIVLNSLYWIVDFCFVSQRGTGIQNEEYSAQFIVRQPWYGKTPNA